MGDLDISSKDTESGSTNDFFEKMEMIWNQILINSNWIPMDAAGWW